LYHVLKDAGVTQRQIAALTGQSQSEVSEIPSGRKVLAYDVLVRIADGPASPASGWGCPGGVRMGTCTALKGPTLKVFRPPTPRRGLRKRCAAVP
jgi:transcriptional regulator with XRE-family HTH domain